ncbi:MAG TPA: glycosyltransferase [Solirubrobacteraceae bacterium]
MTPASTTHAPPRALPSVRVVDGTPADVGIVHDYLNQRGGAERVVLELADMWPAAPIYTSFYRAGSTFPEYGDRDIRRSFIDRLPVDRGFRSLAPLYPAAFRSLGTLEHDLVISSSSGWAHGVRTAPGATHVVYCYAPARWLYGQTPFLRPPSRRTALGALLAGLRRWDQAAARRPDAYIAIAENVRRRIRAAYGIDAPVVYPPVDTARFEPRERGQRLLVVSRLLQYKRIDLAVRAATRAGIGLDVVGVGPTLDELRGVAGPTVTFHGRLDDRAVTELIEGCRAVIVPAAEDFGMVPIEANAAGKPVVAFAGGGALETLEDGVTAALFHESTVESVLEALHRVDRLPTPPAELHRRAERFGREAFRESFRAAVGRVLAARRGALPVAA